MIDLILEGFYRARRRKRIGGAVVVCALLVSIVGNAITFYLFERGIHAELSVGDSFWYSMISITTIGYGDLSATTLGARVGTIIFITILGLTAFTASAGMIINWLIDLQNRERSGLGRLYLKNHILIINYPHESRVRNIIADFSWDSSHEYSDITLVTDRLESMPFQHSNVHFLRGSPLEMETYSRAAVADAQKAIILSTGYDDPNSDSVVASAASVLHRSNPNIMATLECENPRHAVLFEGMEKTSLVFPLQMANNLLVQESQDPGVSLLAQVITSNKLEGTLLSLRLEDIPDHQVSYPELAKNMLDRDVNVVGIVRDGPVHLRFTDLFPLKDDVLVYIASSRLEWESVEGTLASVTGQAS